jgi:hypothetical protein
MMKRLARFGRIAPLLVFAIGLTMYIGKSTASKRETPKSFVATYQVTRVKPNSSPVVNEIQILVAKATGEYKLTKYYTSKGATRTLVATKDSVYEIQPDCLQYFDKAWTEETRQHFYSAKHLRSSPEFAREEVVCGLNTLVLRGVDNADWIEKYYAPQMGGRPLKTVIHLGNDEYIVNEAISI